MFKKIGKSTMKSMLIVFLTLIIFATPVFAFELKADVTEDFINWEENGGNEFSMPRAYNVPIKEEEQEPEIEIETKSNLVSGLFKKSRVIDFTPVGATISDSRYDMADHLNLRVENQGSTSECWAFSTIKSMETNIAKRTGTKNLLNFSERHIDYATSKTFLDGTNPISYNREIGGGLPLVALGYLTNGTGAVLESDMPFEDNQNKIRLSEINKPVDTIVTDYATLPIIVKKYQKDASGNTISVTYTDSNGKIYSDAEVQAIRNTFKRHIINDGALFSFTAGNKSIYYNIDQSNPTASVFDATNYNCNSDSVTRDHAVTIVGWDDNYSRNNFVAGHRPSTDGAYIVLNSYGEESFDNGYIYISYEDSFIESECYCVTGTHTKDFDNIYQSDFYGGVYAIGTDELESGYFAHTFSRNTSKVEYLDSVGITLADYAKVEIFINPNGDSLNLSKLTKIGGTSTELEPGYHRIPVTRTSLRNSQYSIVVKQTESGSDARFYFSVETPVKNTVFANATSDGPSAYSEDGYAWEYFSEINVSGMDMTKTDVCIKAFTTYEGGTDPEPTKEVTSVVISPSKVELKPGDNKTFSANVYGTNLTPQDTGVKFHLEWKKSLATNIDQNGVLTIGNDETAGTIKVVAESIFDPSKTAIALVTVKREDPVEPEPIKEITYFVVGPDDVTLEPGQSKQFAVDIRGNNLEASDKNVRWSVTGKESSNTKIDQNGVLTIGSDETSLEVKVIAESTFDSAITDDTLVKVLYKKPEKEVTGITINPLSTSLKPGESKQFTAKVQGKNLESSDVGVKYSTIDNISNNTKITESGLLTIGQDEKAAVIKVKAESKYNPEKTAIAYVTIIKDEPEEPTDPTFTSKTYKITEDDIYKIMEETTIANFKKNINSDFSYSIYKDGVVVSDDKTIIQTGMKLVLSNSKEYTLVVRGDINLDGKVTLVDLSKQILHFNETKGFILSSPAVKGADMNYDGDVTLLDISQMLVYFNSK